MTSVAEGAAAQSEFQHRGAFFRNVVIICALLAGSLAVAANLFWRYSPIPKEEVKAHEELLSEVEALGPLGLLAIVQVMPRGAWRWVGLVALILAGLYALTFLLCLTLYGPQLPMLLGAGRTFFPLFSHTAACLSCFLADTVSWLYLGLYCRGWAREFAAAKLTSSAGAGNQESAQKETV